MAKSDVTLDCVREMRANGPNNVQKVPDVVQLKPIERLEIVRDS